ncbi:hypothetical protein ACFYW9_27690 [Streptomyces sp. NPDC002698]|uniref:hypothetical protein n=1 Tax=Streptomyces sp. NPDC002698 TaxID=3364660 RepID=UPI0036B5303E
MINADDLERRASRLDGVPPVIARFLLEQGHLGVLVAAAREGEWFCAKVAVGELLRRGEPEAAWEAISPYADTGWWDAVEGAAGVLEALGRAAEAIALVRAQVDGGNWVARPVLAGLLARNGRVDEAIELLRPDLDEVFLLRALVETTEGHGRDAEVAALLRPLVENETCCGNREALIQLSRVLERQGCADEAAVLLRSRIDADFKHVVHVGVVKELGELLVRQDRLAELRAFVAEPQGEHALSVLATRLDELGRVDEAVALLRPRAADGRHRAAGSLV